MAKSYGGRINWKPTILTPRLIPAIMLVSAYLVERGLILEPYQVDRKTNEIKALPEFIENLALKGVVIAFDAISTQKNLSPHH
jgi:hypothetical protein